MPTDVYSYPMDCGCNLMMFMALQLLLQQVERSASGDVYLIVQHGWHFNKANNLRSTLRTLANDWCIDCASKAWCASLTIWRRYPHKWQCIHDFYDQPSYSYCLMLRGVSKRLWVDAVSCFNPPTWKSRRHDLYNESLAPWRVTNRKMWNSRLNTANECQDVSQRLCVTTKTFG